MINEPGFLPVIDFPNETMGFRAGIVEALAGLGAFALTLVLPGLPVFVDEQYLLVGLLVAMVTGLLSGVAPARRANSIDPIEALYAD